MAAWWRDAAAELERGDLEAALNTLRRAAEAGDLWRVSVFAIPQLRPLVEHPEARPLIVEALRRVAARSPKPELVLARPPGSGVAPLLLHLHGRGAAPPSSCPTGSRPPSSAGSWRRASPVSPRPRTATAGTRRRSGSGRT